VKTRQLTNVLALATTITFFTRTGHTQSPAATPDGTPAAPAAVAASGLRDYIARTVKVTAALRVRWEGPDGSDFTVSPADSYTLTRIRVGMAFQPTPWLRVFGEVQDARAEFYKTPPSSALVDPFDLRQSYIELGKTEGNGFKVRAGRQDLAIGSGRLVSSGDWSNVTKSFDILHGYYTSAGIKVDVIAGSVVLADPTRMDRNKPGERFYVAYTSFNKVIPAGVIEPYVMAKTALNVKGKDGVLGNADTIYGGARVMGKTPYGFDYSAEAVREGGGYAHDTVQAFGYVAGGGWTFSRAPWHPRLNADYAWASGDDNRKDGHHQSFDYLYGTQQPMYSLTGIFAWRNIADWRAGVELTPRKNLTLSASFRDFWLATVQDGLYNCGGTRTVFNAKATSNHVGEGLEAIFSYRFNSRTTLGAGIGTVAPGSYLKQSNKTTGFTFPYITFTRQL
jgi:hypothetical protein